MPPIFLIGYMCSGKTTLGRALSVYTGLTFVDLDQAIEQRDGRSVREIFDTEGEAYFRDIEARMLTEIAQRQDIIIACGGGTPCRPGAMEMMNECGLTVYLETNVCTLVRRLMQGREQRPLVRHLRTADEMSAFVADALDKRLSYYRQAKSTFDSSSLDTPEQIDETVRQFASQYIAPINNTRKQGT